MFLQYISIYRSNQQNLGLYNKIRVVEVEKEKFGENKSKKETMIIFILLDNIYDISFKQNSNSTITLAISLGSVFLFKLNKRGVLELSHYDLRGEEGMSTFC